MIYAGRQTAQPFAQCVECGRLSGPYWIRWRAYRIEDPDSDQAPEIALYCTPCADRVFGPRRPRPLDERRSMPRS